MCTEKTEFCVSSYLFGPLEHPRSSPGSFPAKRGRPVRQNVHREPLVAARLDQQRRLHGEHARGGHQRAREKLRHQHAGHAPSHQRPRTAPFPVRFVLLYMLVSITLARNFD